MNLQKLLTKRRNKSNNLSGMTWFCLYTSHYQIVCLGISRETYIVCHKQILGAEYYSSITFRYYSLTWFCLHEPLLNRLSWYFPGHAPGAPNGNFRENICSEDDLRTRIFATFVVKFLACLPLLGFSNMYKMV